ncbi:hypothetical protein Fmac_003320 [Flemingia macrophylla]|uniref:Uncharacterized protein n=1 Tax=Flemingia macrophylla TaxID=520843 RepID=A0ABD1NMF4_9FABA
MTTTFSATATASAPHHLPSPLPSLSLSLSPPHPHMVNCEFRDNRTRELDSWPALPDEVKECSKNAGFLSLQNLRAAVDLLFLHGGSDMVIAKQAIVPISLNH